MGKSCRKLLREISAVNSCMKLLWENAVANCCGKILHEILVGNSCGNILRNILAGQGGGEKANFRKAVIGGNLAFGNRVMVSQPITIQLGKYCGKMLCETIAG